MIVLIEKTHPSVCFDLKKYKYAWQECWSTCGSYEEPHSLHMERHCQTQTQQIYFTELALKHQWPVDSLRNLMKVPPSPKSKELPKKKGKKRAIYNFLLLSFLTTGISLPGKAPKDESTEAELCFKLSSCWEATKQDYADCLQGRQVDSHSKRKRNNSIFKSAQSRAECFPNIFWLWLDFRHRRIKLVTESHSLILCYVSLTFL